MATLRELIIKISANSRSFQSEISRASRMGQDYYRTMQNGGRQSAAASREMRRALAEVTDQIGETCTVLEMAAGTWHAVLSLDTGGIIFEVKHGGYQPVAADDYAHWAPAEGEPGTTELMAWYAQAQVGDSTFAV